MANRIAQLLGNTKTRTMVLIVLGILIFGVVIAVSQTDSDAKGPVVSAPSRTTEVPNQVKSTPVSDVTRKYQELQEKANIRGAQEAAAKGTTFIPTLTGNVQGYTDEDFEKQLTSAYDNLGGKCSKEHVENLKKKNLDTTAIIMQLKADGCTAEQIAGLFTPDQIAAALLSETACNITGCSADAAKQLKNQGMDAKKIAETLKANGCAVNDIVTALKSSGSTTTEIVSALKASGSSAEEIATALKASGASIDEITTAMKDNGYDAVQIATALTKAGYAKNDVLAALTKSGFSSVEVAKALNELNLAQGTNAAMLAQQQAAQAAADRLRAQQEAQQLAAYSQQRQGKIQELVTAMEGQKKQAMDVWTQVPQQLFTQGEWVTKREREEREAAGDGTSGGSSSRSRTAQNNQIILKAGSILFAVLDTAVDSDEPGPVMATIVSGTLKGSKLLGKMSTNLTSETISLQFTAINMPNEASSMGINAVAIDPETARTALASDVDHHYLYRWGSLLASSFIQGYATAVANSGSTSTTSQGAAGTTTTTSSPAQNSKQQLWSGIAAVGTKWSQVVAQNYERPITVTIDQGTGIGVLVTSDLTYGTDPTFYSPPTTTTTTTAAAETPAGAPANVPGGLGASGSLSNDQRQALWSLLQNSPVTQQAAGSSTVTTTSTMGGTPP